MNVKMHSAPLFVSERWTGDNLPQLYAIPDESITHDTGNRRAGADALMHWRFVINGGGPDEVSFTLTVDDRRIIQIVRFGQATWNASDGYNGRHNRRGISIEDCVNADGDFARMIGHHTWLLAAIQQMPELFDWHDSFRTHATFDAMDKLAELQHFNTAPDKKNCPATMRAIPGLWEKVTHLANTQRVAFKIREPLMYISPRRGSGIIGVNTVRDGDRTMQFTENNLIHARRLIRYQSKLAILTLYGTIIPLNTIRFSPFKVEGLHIAITNDNWRTLAKQNVIQPAYRVRERYKLDTGI